LSTFSVNGYAVTSGSVSFPEAGAWTAQVELAGAPSLSGTVFLSDPVGMAMQAQIVSGGRVSARSRYFIVGGRGGLSKRLPAKHYRSAKAGKVLRDICAASGEILASDISAAYTGATLQFWTRAECTAGAALSQVADEIGAIWRVRADGTVWVGSGSATEQLGQPIIDLDSSPELSEWTAAARSFAVRPGFSTDDGRQILRADYWVGHDARVVYYTA
jgi:hypothetical protein